MDIFSGLRLGWKALTLHSEAKKECDAIQRATEYLIAKYHLSPVQRVIYGTPSQYGTGETVEICDETWEVALATLMRTVITSRVATKEIMESCGDIGLFVLVLAGKERFIQSDRPGLFYRGQPRPCWLVGSLGESETWKSLMEMGRGRGTDFALELIAKELEQWLREEGHESLLKRVESRPEGP